MTARQTYKHLVSTNETVRKTIKEFRKNPRLNKNKKRRR